MARNPIQRKSSLKIPLFLLRFNYTKSSSFPFFLSSFIYLFIHFLNHCNQLHLSLSHVLGELVFAFFSRNFSRKLKILSFLSKVIIEFWFLWSCHILLLLNWWLMGCIFWVFFYYCNWDFSDGLFCLCLEERFVCVLFRRCLAVVISYFSALGFYLQKT